MARGIQTHNEHSGHERPWVYFMVDSFFLVTMFFVVTFHVRVGKEPVIQNDLIGTSKGPPQLTPINSVAVTVLHQAGEAEPRYVLNGGSPLDSANLNARLTDMAGARGADSYLVRVRCEGASTFKDVMAVFNVCKKLGIKKCGLEPAHNPL